MNYANPNSKLESQNSKLHVLGQRLIPDLRAGERVVMLQRRHPVVLFRNLLKPLLLAMFWVLVLLAGSQWSVVAGPDSPPVANPWLPAWLPAVLWLSWLGVAALLVLWGAYLALDWSDHWIALTNRRLIIMDKIPFLRESRREATIRKVRNVTAEYPNNMAVALDFGDLKVDTAGIGGLVFGNLPRPRRMRGAIFNAPAEANAARPSPEDLRRARARSIILGTD